MSKKEVAKKSAEVEGQVDENKEADAKAKAKPKGLLRVGGIGGVAVIAAAVYFGINPAAKFGLQMALESTFGTETEIEAVNVSWSPFGLTIENLQQTDPDNLNRNLFQFDQAEVQVRPLDYLMGNTVIDSLKVVELQFDGARAEPGVRIVKDDQSADTSQGTDSDTTENDQQEGMSFPSSKELLAKADLQTEIKAKNFQQVWKTQSSELKSVYKDLPDKGSVKSYEQQWQEIEDTEISSLDDLKVLKEKVAKLKAEINADRLKIKTAKAKYKTSKAEIDQAYNELKDAPGQDWESIKKTLPIDDPNTLAISQLLFGDKITSYLEQGMGFYTTAKPYLDNYLKNKKAEEAEPEVIVGENIVFPLNDPLPTWLIVDAEISLTLSGKSWLVTASEITSESYVRNIPGEYVMSHVAKQGGSINIEGTFFAAQDAKFTTDGKWNMSELAVNNYSIAGDSDLSLELEHGKLLGSGTFEYENELNSEHLLAFSETIFSGNGTGDFAEILLDSLSSVDQFNINMNVSGKLKSPDLAVDSDLDNKVNSAFRAAVKKEFKKVESETKAELSQKVEQNLTEKAPELQKLRDFGKDLDEWESTLKNKAEDKIDALIDNKKQQFEDKIKKEAEDKIKDKLEDKVKDKLKGFKCCE
ncbi:TIGR03545 family protein [Psychrosphaera sp. 1_MG-2023]|uniref:TIGR03545 family protein n=1 Tax=Psychrosphaera sp. 1_MG-2023 TaxID=3062643 RepID=UPI0026E285C6|nr:TIGR03545 family protein [Psychrosphaera sp. 1_MG-2023]MDO6720601.1 TIGR03545 family protein [Psychrosphaera sp. 1_MG-2023]